MQYQAGYLLTGKTCEQALHFLHGSGANGKTTLCDVLQALLGDYAAVASADLIMVRRYQGVPNDIARLRGVRVVFINETSQGSRFDEERLKDLTGGDRLTGRFLYGEYFDFSPTHKLLIRGNHKPTINGTDEAIWRRVHLIPFNVTTPPADRTKARARHQPLRRTRRPDPACTRSARSLGVINSRPGVELPLCRREQPRAKLRRPHAIASPARAIHRSDAVEGSGTGTAWKVKVALSAKNEPGNCVEGCASISAMPWPEIPHVLQPPGLVGGKQLVRPGEVSGKPWKKPVKSN